MDSIMNASSASYLLRWAFLLLCFLLRLSSSQYFLTPYPLLKSSIPSKPTKIRVIIPPNDFQPLDLNASGVITRQGILNTSAADVFRVVGDIDSHKLWAGYGLQKVVVSENSVFGSAVAHYEAGAFGFNFVFSLRWCMFYADEKKKLPYYVAFTLLKKTPLLDEIEGHYAIQPLDNDSCSVTLVLKPALRGLIPGFVQNKVKQVNCILHIYCMRLHHTMLLWTPCSVCSLIFLLCYSKYSNVPLIMLVGDPGRL